MQLVKTYKFKLNFIGFLSQLFPFVAYFIFIPAKYAFDIKFYLVTMIICFLNRYPHEHLHQKAGWLLGFDSVICFKLNKASCTPVRDINRYETIIFSMAPFMVLSLFYFTLHVILSRFLGFWANVALANSILIYMGCAADFGYTINALKYKNHIFRDNGNTLKILDPTAQEQTVPEDKSQEAGE